MKKLKYFVDAPSDDQNDKDIKIHGNKSSKNQKKVNNNVKRLIESVSYDTMQMLKSAIKTRENGMNKSKEMQKSIGPTKMR